MKFIVCVTTVFSTLFIFASAFAQKAPRITLIPQPQEVHERTGSFTLSNKTTVTSDPIFTDIAMLFAEQIRAPYVPQEQNAENQIAFTAVNTKQFAKSDGYQLVITPDQITISAGTLTGARYGMQSLWQLWLLQPEHGSIPCAEIIDFPRFSYRGVHLDVSRHFFPVSYIKRLLDLMALYKMNYFHWHLTDGPGWRLEIKKHPELTTKAAWRTHQTWKEWWQSNRQYACEGDSNAYGGYYTQKEAREVVAYAARHGITVIPEIEMPGHSEEVLAVYPHLSCYETPGKSKELCLGNEATFRFLEDVLTEVIAIFPSQYIHIGGDEADKAAWQQCKKCQKRITVEKLKDEAGLQSYGVARIAQFLIKQGRTPICWDEILEGGLPSQATVMAWRGEVGGISAAQAGHYVIMTPDSYCYFDHYQADPLEEPFALGGYLPLEKVYFYEPVPSQLTRAEAKHVLGAQANIWTEFIPTTAHLEYMVFPRLLALSEVVWSSPTQRNWDDFKTRLETHYPLLQKLNVNYRQDSVLDLPELRPGPARVADPRTQNKIIRQQYYF